MKDIKDMAQSALHVMLNNYESLSNLRQSSAIKSQFIPEILSELLRKNHPQSSRIDESNPQLRYNE